MHILNFIETLMYFDGPILIIARDQLALDHLCLLIETTDEESDSYLCIPISKGRLSHLVEGELDVRSIFEKPETDEAYIGKLIENKIEGTIIQEIDYSGDWLPDPGVFLKKNQLSDNKIVQESVEKGRGIIYCTLNPPEALEESKITADHLSEAVRLFQRLVKYSYNKSIEKKPISEKRARDEIASADNFTLDILAFSAGSFTLHMQTRAPADMLGYSHVSRAMDIIDSICYEADDPKYIVETLAEYGGDLVVAYRDLLQYIVDTKTTFSYQWAMPVKKESSGASIIPRIAQPLYEAITSREELGKEEIKLTGRFTKVDEDTGSWRLVEDDNKKYYGESYISLGGITIETQRYEIICEKVLETEPATKKDRKKIYIKSLEQL